MSGWWGADPDLAARLAAGVETDSPIASQDLAARLARALPPDVTLALHGPIGAGKTTFVQGLARAWGITGPVHSPTFQLYAVHRGRDRLLLHLDAYRLDRPEQVESLLIEDFLDSPWCLAVEWPSRVAAWLPRPVLHLECSITGPGRHRIRGGEVGPA